VQVTNREVISAFKTLIADKAQVSDDNGWSSRLIYFHLLRHRNKLLLEKLRVGRVLSRYNFQTISCVSLVEVDLNECPCAPASGCTFLKTSLPIPQPLMGFKTITSVDGTIKYTYLDWDKFTYKINSRIRPQAVSPYYTVKTIGTETYLYVYNDNHKETVTITAIFENPIDVQVFPDCEGKVDGCIKKLDLRFIIDPDLLDTVYDIALQKLMRAKAPVSDIMNNDKDDISQPPIPLK
jgi:hypothetical protein